MLGFLSEYEVFYDVLGFANFVLNEFATQAGPINKNCKSSKNDGFFAFDFVTDKLPNPRYHKYAKPKLKPNWQNSNRC